MCVGSVCTHPSYNDKNLLLKSSFSNQAVLRFLSEWCSSVQAPPTIVDWQHRLTLDPPEWAVISPSLSRLRCRGRQECLWLNDWGVLLLNVIMNIAVVIYSRHLSRWRRRGLMLHLFWSECADPRATEMLLCSPESFVIQLHLQKKWI